MFRAILLKVNPPYLSLIIISDTTSFIIWDTASSDWFLSGPDFPYYGLLLMSYTCAEPDVRSKEFPVARSGVILF